MRGSAVANWEDSTTTTFDQRHYFCQNWRGDVVEIVTSDGKRAETYRYTAYGVPYGIPLGDVNDDGSCNVSDNSAVIFWINNTTYEVRGDLDLDGDVDTADQTIVQNNYGSSLGLGELSLDPHSSVGGLGIRKGYAGYEHDGVDHTICHVRHRVLLTELGRWTRRDPLGYVDGMSLYEYVASSPIPRPDSSGLSWTITSPGGTNKGDPQHDDSCDGVYGVAGCACKFNKAVEESERQLHDCFDRCRRLIGDYRKSSQCRRDCKIAHDNRFTQALIAFLLCFYDRIS